MHVAMAPDCVRNHPPLAQTPEIAFRLHDFANFFAEKVAATSRRDGARRDSPTQVTGAPFEHHELLGTPAHGLGMLGSDVGSGCILTPVAGG